MTHKTFYAYAIMLASTSKANSALSAGNLTQSLLSADAIFFTVALEEVLFKGDPLLVPLARAFTLFLLLPLPWTEVLLFVDLTSWNRKAYITKSSTQKLRALFVLIEAASEVLRLAAHLYCCVVYEIIAI